MANDDDALPVVTTGSGPPVGNAALIASAKRIDFDSPEEKKRYKRRSKSWQDEAWRYYDECGEAWFAANFIANCLRKVRLYAAEQPDRAQPPIPIDPTAEGIQGAAREQVDRLHEADGGMGGIMAGFGLNLSVPGECVLVGTEDVDLGGEKWTVYSSDELFVRGDGKWAVRGTPSDRKGTVLDENSVAYRVWRAHPRFKDQADSPMRPLLDIIEELLILSRAIRAAGRSRLAGAGMLLWPSEVSFGSSSSPTQQEGAGQAVDPVLADLMTAMMTPIADEGVAAAVVPVLMKLPSASIDKVKHILFARPIDPQLAAQRKELIQRMANGLDVPAQVILGIEDVNHWCVDDETEILTVDGWRRYDEIDVGTEVLTLNHETGMSEWQPVESTYRADVVDEPMVTFDGRNHSSLTTPHHKWPTVRPNARGFVLSRDLTCDDRIVTAARSVDVPTSAKWSDSFVEIVGWFWTEGHLTNDGRSSIAQSHTRNPERVDRIRAALTTWLGPVTSDRLPSDRPAWREAIQTNDSSFGGPVTVFHLNQAATVLLTDVAPGKVVSPTFVRSLTFAQLALFTETSEAGDGQHYRQGRSDIWQRRSDMLDGYALALILQGRTVQWSEADDGWRVAEWSGRGVRPVKAARAKGREISTTYTGTIWCPVTRNHTWFARRRGTTYFTGNTGWMIDEQTFKSHLEPLVVQICGALTSEFLRPTLGIGPAENVLIWYDASGLIGHPNRSQDANEAYDRYEISGEALRRYKGFPEDDKPTDAEIQARVARKALERLGPLRSGEVIGEATDVSTAEETEPGIPATGPDAGGVLTSAALRSIVAASTVKRTRVRLGLRLAQQDKDLRVRLVAASDAAMFRAMERAGATLRRYANRDAAVKAMIRDVPNAEVAARLGLEAVLSYGVDTQVVLDDSFDTLRTRFDREVQQAQQRLRKMIEANDTNGDVDLDALAAEQRDDRETATTLLVAALSTLATERMFNPHPEAPAIGEHDSELAVPPGYVREALAVAGGGDVPLALDGKLDAPYGGVMTGTVAMDIWSSLGIGPQGYEWMVGAPDRPFDPHAELDGAEFASFDDEVLAADGAEFPFVDHYFPGDHNGCQCDFAPLMGGDGGDVAEPGDDGGD